MTPADRTADDERNTRAHESAAGEGRSPEADRWRFGAAVEQQDELIHAREECRRLHESLAAILVERDQAREKAGQLQVALTSRVIIEQAKGMLAGRRGIGIDDAFEVLRRYSRNHNARIHDVAVAVVAQQLLNP